MLLALARRHDGRIVAINSAALFRNRQEAEAVYHAALAARLQDLGFTVRRRTGKGRRYFEIEGIPKALADDWSSRSAEIAGASPEWVEQFRATHGRAPTVVELRGIAVRHRIAKGQPHPCPRTFWQIVGGEHGVTEDSVAEMQRDGTGLPPADAARRALIEELLSPEGLTREHATFTMAALRTEAMVRAAGRLTVEDIERAVDELIRDDAVVQVSDGVWTTQEMLDLEQRALSWRQERDALPAFQPATQRQLWNGLRIQQEHDGVSLEGEQLDAYRALLSQRTPAITGQAGTGKGAVLSAAGHVWRTQGRRIFAVALAGATAQRLAAQLGDGAKAFTIDALCLRLERDPGGVRDEDVIVVDEAGMIDTRRWAKLAAALGPKATVVAVGDHAQLSPISAGGLWPVLAEGSVQLQRVYRTPVAWQRDAWRHPRDGRSIEALSAYASHGLLAVVDTRDEALAAAVDAWNREGRTGQIITDATNAERHRANQAAQARRREAGELGEASLTVTCDEGPVTLHSGDRVIFRAQVHVPDARRVENGTTGEIVAVHADSGEVEVRTNEPVSRTVRVSAGDAQLDLAYAGHIHVLQGATTDTAYIVCGGWQTDRQRLYTCVSRSRNAAQVFVDRESLGRDAEAAALDELARRAQRDGGKVAASSHLRETRRRPRAPATRPKRPMSLVHRYARRQGRLETLWQQRFAEYQTIRRRVLRRWSADYQVAMSQQQIEHLRTSGPR